MSTLRYIILVNIFFISNIYGWDNIENYGKNVVTVIYTEITLEKAEEVISKIEKIKNANKEPILLLLATSGGHGALVISNYMKLVTNKIDVLAIGPCNSGGSFLLASATGKRFMVNDVIIGIHIPNQNSDNIVNKFYTKMYYDFLKSYCNLKELHLLELKKTGVAYFDAESALNNGIVDEIIKPIKK